MSHQVSVIESPDTGHYAKPASSADTIFWHPGQASTRPRLGKFEGKFTRVRSKRTTLSTPRSRSQWGHLMVFSSEYFALASRPDRLSDPTAISCTSESDIALSVRPGPPAWQPRPQRHPAGRLLRARIKIQHPAHTRGLERPPDRRGHPGRAPFPIEHGRLHACHLEPGSGDDPRKRCRREEP